MGSSDRTVYILLVRGFGPVALFWKCKYLSSTTAPRVLSYSTQRYFRAMKYKEDRGAISDSSGEGQEDAVWLARHKCVRLLLEIDCCSFGRTGIHQVIKAHWVLTKYDKSKWSRER